MGQFIHQFTEWSNSIPSTGYIPISISGDTYRVTKELLHSGITGSSSISILNDLSDVLVPSPSSGQVLRYNGSAWVNGSPISGEGQLELQYTGVTMTGTMTISTTGWVDIMSGELILEGNNSQVDFSAQIAGQGSSTSTIGWFRVIESNLTSGTSGAVFVGQDVGNRTPITVGLVLKSSDIVVLPITMMGIKTISGSAGDHMAYTVQGKCYALVQSIYINRNSVDSNAGTYPRTSSFIKLRELA